MKIAVKSESLVVGSVKTSKDGYWRKYCQFENDVCSVSYPQGRQFQLSLLYTRVEDGKIRHTFPRIVAAQEQFGLKVAEMYTRYDFEIDDNDDPDDFTSKSLIFKSRGRNNRFRQLLKDDLSWWDTVVTGLAELVGTAVLVFMTCMGCVGSLSSEPSGLQTALASGFTVTCVIQTIGHISVAHINPAVTVCSVLLGLKSITTAAVYIVAQMLGGVIGYGMLKVITPSELLHTGNTETKSTFCVTALNNLISPIQGLLTETMATGILILLCCASWDPRNGRNSDSTAIKFGLTVATLSMAVGPYTGCSMNPARTFAPALWNNEWSFHWIYWLGPIAGSTLISLGYKTLFWPKKSLKEDSPEAAALNSVDTQKPEHN